MMKVWAIFDNFWEFSKFVSDCIFLACQHYYSACRHTCIYVIILHVDIIYRWIVTSLQADPGLAAKRLFELVHEQPQKIAILGPPKSNPYQIVGQITPKFNLVQVNVFVWCTSICYSYYMWNATNFLKGKMSEERYF
jgi:hypothetical protein